MIAAPPQGYRPNVGICLVNAKGQVFAAERIDAPGAWQMPQGGIDAGEDILIAARRELQEEIGVRSIRPLAWTRGWLAYDFPPRLRSHPYLGQWRGQAQRWLLARFIGEDREIDLAAHSPREFRAWAWLDLEQLQRQIVAFKRDTYATVLRAFAPVIAGAEGDAGLIEPISAH